MQKYFIPTLKSEKMGVDSYYLELMDLLETVKNDKDYFQSIDIIYLIRIMQYLFFKYRKKLHIVQWKKHMHDFNANIGHYWFFIEYEDLREKYVELSKKNINNLIHVLNINLWDDSKQ